MAALNLTTPGLAGTAETMTAAAVAGDSFPLPGDITIRVRNANVGAARNVTIVGQKACNYGVVHSAGPITVPANSTILIEVPGGDDRFRDGSGRVQLTYDNNADLTLAAYPS